MINFEKENETSYTVLVNDEKAGELKFDVDQDAWVFSYSEDGVTYENSLSDSMQELKDDFEDGKNDSAVVKFGDYDYEK